eukprot:CAMPEP_0184086830 /NCGR_PEP_ID=MMETSP0974-20121125/5410_1 /TAXON_ID=483370 /ORGANISM="non described non described, Strain CCMP2097" /LENGTH=123 /DNA_ID=CAMNT_0026389521 /DNA_START=15 /DNA_END=384 /DNA_ORIENTATION=+
MPALQSAEVQVVACRVAAPVAEARNKGNAEAQAQLGQKYHAGGFGLQKNAKRAVQLCHLAAAQGHAAAQFAIGRSYEVGEGVHYKTAVQWYRRAAEQEFPDARGNLGVMFFYGKGVAQSYDEA